MGSAVFMVESLEECIDCTYGRMVAVRPCYLIPLPYLERRLNTGVFSKNEDCLNIFMRLFGKE